MTEEDTSFDTPHDINAAIRESLKQTRSLKITDMAGMNSIAVGLNEVAKITVEGTAGDYFGAFNGAATLRLIGDAGKYAGDSMSGGILRIEGNTGYGTGTYLMGGTINVAGNCGVATGQRMYEGVIAVKGHTGPLAGVGMKGGMIFIDGKCADNAGHNIEGGVIYARSFKSLGENAMELPLSKVDKSRLIEYLEIDELEIEEFKKIVPKEEEPSREDEYPVVLHDAPENYLSKITSSPSFSMYGKEDLVHREDVDLEMKVGTGLGTLTVKAPFLIYDNGETSPTVLKEAEDLRIPIIVGDLPPALYDEDEDETPPAYRIVRMSPERKGTTVELISRSKGIELVLGSGSGYYRGGELISSMPERPLDVNSAEDVRNFLECLREVTLGSRPVFVTVSGENVYDLVIALAKGRPDGIILKSQLPTTALTVAKEALDDADKRDRIGLYVLGDYRSVEDVYKIMAMGAKGIALMFPDTGAKVEKAKEAFSLKRLVQDLRVLMAYNGHTTPEDLSEDDLRALDYSTAAITGLKLIGYDQKLPIWRR
jgi:hypothetical protein